MARRAFFERRDLLNVMCFSYVSMSSLASNPRFDIDVSKNLVSDSRSSFLRAAFPYFKFDSSDRAEEKSYEDYSEYFDELDRIEDEQKNAKLDGEHPK